jgi:hypothetical protein
MQVDRHDLPISSHLTRFVQNFIADVIQTHLETFAAVNATGNLQLKWLWWIGVNCSTIWCRGGGGGGRWFNENIAVLIVHLC